MHKFMALHTLPAGAFTHEQVCQIAEAGQHEQSVRGYRSFLNLTEGKVCCILEANDRESVVAWFQKMRIPYDSIVAVEFEGDRGVIEDLREQPAMAGAG